MQRKNTSKHEKKHGPRARENPENKKYILVFFLCVYKLNRRAAKKSRNEHQKNTRKGEKNEAFKPQRRQKNN
jgi:hypothetical protein